MASNLTEIVNVLENVNYTLPEISIENIIPNAIQSTNESTGGWLGITVFAIFCLSVLFHIMYNKNSFQIFDKLNLIFVSMSIWIDLGIQLLLFGILANVQIFVALYVSFFVIAVISFLKKELVSPDT